MKISPSVRVSFGLVMFTLSVFLIADLIGLIPKKDIMLLEARKKICESLAVQLSVAASRSEFEIVKSTLEVFVERNNDVIAASMSQMDGEKIAKFGDFVEFDEMVFDNGNIKSSDNVVVVPVFAGAKQWGAVNVEFNSLYAVGWLSLLTDSILGILLFVAIGCFGGYLFILRKALKVLDPKSVVPDRVRTAFNTLSEGVMIMDDKEQIIMANNAFAEKINEKPDDLLGIKASSLKWKHFNREQHEKDAKMPWVSVIKEGANKVGVALKLSTRGSGVRSLTTNCAPILDDKGKSRGALVTFSDVTEIHETNTLLENAVTTLQKNESEIKRKNSELEILASRDSLTGCYNRRAFFDLFENGYDVSEGTGKPLSCIMLDIDHFKSINDRFGHTIGDEAIRLVADILNNHCKRKTAIVGRYGGEEFCVVLPGVDIEMATNIAERLRQAIMTTSKDFCAKNVVITCSFGVSCNSETVSNCSQILEEADKALYIAKESGRNKVICTKQSDSVSSINDTVVLDITDKNHKDNQEETSASGEISLLKSKIDYLQNKLHEFGKQDAIDESKIIDPITKLPSQLIFMDRVNQAVAYSVRSDKLMAVATLNVDMFSHINDAMGQEVGDDFLRAVGHRLKNILRRSDTVASMMSPGQGSPSFTRLKDDEFGLLLTGLDSIESMTYIIKRIQNKFAGKMEIAGKEVYVSTSIGVSVSPQDGRDAKQLIDNSRRAQKQAKKLNGRNNYQFYSLDDNSKIVDQMQIEIELHNAIEDKQFVLFYQPKLNISSGDVTSVESLIRWNHPTKGMIFPNDFIPVAEKTGMISDIGKWCLLEACRQTKLWVDMGLTDIRTSVNASVHEFTDENFKDIVLNSLKVSGLDASHLEIEITESIIIEDAIAAKALINDLRFHGITITLDDFGTGYSSLSYFGNFELDWLKLDRSFLLEAMSNDRSRTIYSGIVEMAHKTGVKVVSEGVETDAEYSYILDLNVDEMQGYIISKPVCAESVEAIIFPDQEQTLKLVK